MMNIFNKFKIGLKKSSNSFSAGLNNLIFKKKIDVNILNNPSPPNNKCGTCSKCLDICPTNAFLSPYKLDARKCISYLTIENKGHIPREFRKVIKNRIYGCDDCLAVCPWNKFAKKSNNISFIAREDLKKPSLKSLSLLSDLEFRFLFAGSPIKRIGRNQFIRNVVIAIGNSSDKSLIKTIKILLNDNSILVRVASVWALSMLSKKVFMDEIDKRIKHEKNKVVINEWLESKEEIISNSIG